MMTFNIDRMLPYRDKVEAAIRRVIDRDWYIYGEEIEKFEEEWGAYTNQSHVVGVGSGTSAIQIALEALGIGPGDEVITPAFNVAYTAMAIAATGAKPVFVDVRESDLTLDPRLVVNAITPNTRAIVPVHLYGAMAQMAWLRDIADAYRLVIVEDAAQAHGTTALDGVIFSPGHFAEATAYSFYPTKNLGALGEAGAITTNIPAVAKKARLLRDAGRTDRYVHVVKGTNSCLDEIQAAVLRAKLPYLDERIAARRKAADVYDGALGFRGRARRPGDSVHLYVINAGERRAELMEFLKGHGVPTLIHYPVPAPLQPAFLADTFDKGPWPVAETWSRQVLSLPMHADILETEQLEIARLIKEFDAKG